MDAMPSWDDLRFVLAVSRSRTLQEAAARLGVTHGTVSRRLSAVERRCGDRVFARTDEGYVASSLGRRLVDAAERMERAASRLERELVEGADLEGTLRVSTLTLFLRVLAPDLAAFRGQHPQLRLCLDSSRANARLDRNEAQVVIRATDQPLPTLVGRAVGRLAFAPYAASSLVEAEGSDPSDLPWLDWSDPFGRRHLATYLASHAPTARRVGELAVFEDMLALVEAGAGAAALPCVDGDANPTLVRVGDVIHSFSLGIWLLTHPGLRDAPRVRAFMAAMGGALDRLRPRFEGRAPAGAREST